MLVADLIRTTETNHIINTIKIECSQFLSDSTLPLYRFLPTAYDDLQRVKVRTKKKTTQIKELFNKAFEDRYTNLSQRAVFAYPTISETLTTDFEPFYVFPINGYKFAYCKEVENSNEKYQQMIDTLFEQLNSSVTATDIVIDAVKFSYSTTNLQEGINHGAEVILYNIPYYYAVKVKTFPSYNTILKS